MGRPLREIYPHATRFQVLKWKIKEGLKWCVRKLFQVGMIGGVGYAIFMAGAYFNPVITYATQEKEVLVKDDSFPVILQKICMAESGGKQFKADGNVVRGRVNPSDIGYCQINEPIWNDKARQMGLDIYTEKGNKDMAKFIFENYGTDPWNSSKAGWKK